MKALLLSVVVISVLSCGQKPAAENVTVQPQLTEEKAIGAMLDSFNVAAANADFEKYFGFYTSNATFNGTDATENWNKDSFMVWAKPFFDKKKAWNFHAIKRNIYFGNTPGFAWFDELLSTQMKICRGSGVLVKEADGWKVQQYVLSMTIPNDILAPVLALKTPIEDSLISVLEH